METRRKFALLTLSLLLLLVTTWAPPAARLAAQAQANSRYFPPTGHSIQGRFLAYWDSHGGLAQQGYPLSNELSELSPVDGKTYTIQYFERAIFEFHPENKEPYDVLLSLLGVLRYKAKYSGEAANQTASTTPGVVFFKETSKTIGGPFLAYWQSHGGLIQQGLPISDEFQEKSEIDGKTYTVQYFERAVFEYHPENAGTPYEVLLSLLGSYAYEHRHGARNQALALPAPRPGFRQWDPHGSGSYLTWTEMSYDVPGEDDVLALNLATAQVSMVTDKPARQDGQDLSGSLVLWKDQGLCPTACGKSDIYATDLASGQLYEIAGPVGSEYNGEARIAGHAVVWLAYANSNPSVLLRDLDTGATITVARPELAPSGGLSITHVAVSEDYVVWDGALLSTRVVGDQRYQVRAYNRLTEEVRTVASGPLASYELAPDLALSGDRLVWADTRTHAADLNTGTTWTLPLQDGDSPMLRGNLLIWHWQHAILAAHLGDSLAAAVVIGDLTTDYGAPTLAGDWVVWETEIGPNAGHLGTRPLSNVFNLPPPAPTAMFNPRQDQQNARQQLGITQLVQAGCQHARPTKIRTGSQDPRCVWRAGTRGGWNSIVWLAGSRKLWRRRCSPPIYQCGCVPWLKVRSPGLVAAAHDRLWLLLRRDQGAQAGEVEIAPTDDDGYRAFGWQRDPTGQQRAQRGSSGGFRYYLSRFHQHWHRGPDLGIANQYHLVD
jgi:hypothetical protein